MNEEEIKARAEEILKKEDPLEFIVRTIQKIHKGDELGIALTYYGGLTPSMPTNQLHLDFMGGSGKGKGDAASSVLLTFPEKYYKVLTSVSPKALHYAKNQNKLIENGIIYIDEAQASQDAIPILRALTSSGRIKPVHLTVDDKKKSLELSLKGKYSIWLSSITPLPDDQLKNRFLFVNVDESKERDEEVWKHQDKIYRGGREQTISEDEDFVICRAITENVISSPMNIKIPYKIEWSLKHNRRLYPFFVTIIKSSVFLHKYQREIDLDNFLIATKYDFDLTLTMWEYISNWMEKRVNQEALNLYELIPNDRSNAIKRSELTEKSNLPSRNVKYLTDMLTGAGLINVEALDERGRPNVYWKKSVSNCPYVAKVNWEEAKEDLKENIQFLRQNPESAEKIIDSVLSKGVALPYFCRKESCDKINLPRKNADKSFWTKRQIKTKDTLEEKIINLIPINQTFKVGVFEQLSFDSNLTDKVTLHETFWQLLKKWEKERRIEYVTESEIVRRY